MSPSTWFIDLDAYGEVRQRCRAGDRLVEPHAASLRQSAGRLCLNPAPAVTEKQFTRHSPSRDPHDYVSIATYWWPDPNTQDGLPYASRDGQPSPDIELYDRPRWEQAASGILTLVRAAWFLDEPRFAQTAASWLRRWFLDTQTRMNPDLAFAQFIPGVCSGRQYGIIDFALYLPQLLDHVRLLAELEDSPWTATDQSALASWCDALLAWLESHPFGRQEEAAKNNHGTYYDRLAVGLALFLDRPERAQTQLVRTRERSAKQIAADGSTPHEMKRTCSLSYSVMNTRCFVELAWIGRRLGVDLWSGADAAGPVIPRAVDFIFVFACSNNEWPGEQIEPFDWRMVCPLLERASALSCRRYDPACLAHRQPANFLPDLLPLLEPIHPFGQARSHLENQDA